MSDLLPVYLEHGGTVLTGQAAMPRGIGPFPGVLVMHNALGLGNHVTNVARRLADQGYVAVATDMYGGGASANASEENARCHEALISDPEFLRDRVNAWYDRIANMVEVSANRVAAIGYCFGGTCVLELARSGAPARAVVSNHGTLTTTMPMPTGGYDGEVLAFCGARDPFTPAEDIEEFQAEMAVSRTRSAVTVFSDAARGFSDPESEQSLQPGYGYHAMSDRLAWAGTTELLSAVL